jgi:hypothetical protein
MGEIENFFGKSDRCLFDYYCLVMNQGQWDGKGVK